MKAYVFPGQGAQFPGMGKDLYENSDIAKQMFETANEIHFYAANVEQVYLGDNIFGPQSDSDVDIVKIIASKAVFEVDCKEERDGAAQARLALEGIF